MKKLLIDEIDKITSFEKFMAILGTDNLPSEYKIKLCQRAFKALREKDLLNFLTAVLLRRDIPMEAVYFIYAEILRKSTKNSDFFMLGERYAEKYKNEMMDRMYKFRNHSSDKPVHKDIYDTPVCYFGKAEDLLPRIEDGAVHLVFTSPPYYNARSYSNYTSYIEYLESMRNVVRECHRVLEDGRFIVINVSPVITPRPDRMYESIRYPIHFDFHRILTECGFYFVDEIIWVKPEPAVKDRNGGFRQHPTPLAYKPNCVTESLLVYRKDCNFLIDKNMLACCRYQSAVPILDRTNVWKISPSRDKRHPAVFPEDLVEKVLYYYSFKYDVILDPFAGIGTTGKVAIDMRRTPILCEKNFEYYQVMLNDIEKTGFTPIQPSEEP